LIRKARFGSGLQASVLECSIADACGSTQFGTSKTLLQQWLRLSSGWRRTRTNRLTRVMRRGEDQKKDAANDARASFEGHS
jgi:hypothetical protein